MASRGVTQLSIRSAQNVWLAVHSHEAAVNRAFWWLFDEMDDLHVSITW